VAVELARPATQVRNQIEDARREGAALLESAPRDATGLVEFRERYLSWESRTSAVLETGFKVSGFMTTSPKDEFNGTAVSLLDLKISAAATIPFERLPEVLTDIREKVRVLKSVDERLDVYEAPITAPAERAVVADAPIFLVHGRDLQRREIVRRFLETVTDRTIVVLAEQPNRGQDLLGKLLSHAQQAGFAVVLLTPDDLGGFEGDEPKLDSVGDLGNRRRVAVEDRLAASRLPQVGVVDRVPEVVRCRCVPGSERKSRSSPRG